MSEERRLSRSRRQPNCCFFEARRVTTPGGPRAYARTTVLVPGLRSIHNASVAAWVKVATVLVPGLRSIHNSRRNNSAVARTVLVPGLRSIHNVKTEHRL